MLMYLRHAIEAEPSLNNPQTFSEQKLDEALYHGAVLRVRPKAMTVAVIIAGLLPILWGTGAGSEVMSPDCRTDDWRHDHRTFAVAVYYPGGV
ncbi:cation efflux system protein [Escherichia coli]|nr:cation efflux system protein [Escherichia coli]